MKNVVVIGGGNGSALAITALKSVNFCNLSAVVAMSDSGGSSGVLRKEFSTLPMGDILRAVLAMSKYDYDLLKKIFYSNRFSQLGKLSDHNLGNLFLVLSEKYSRDFLLALQALESSVEAVGKVYPATLDKNDLCAELSSGSIIKTEAKLDGPEYDRKLKIKRVWLEPKAKIYSGAEQAILEAHHIIIGPGSLYTSVIAALLPAGVKEAVEGSSAKLWYIAGDAYTLNGETGPEKLSNMVKDLELYLPRALDGIIYHSRALTTRQKKMYSEMGWGSFEKDIKNLEGRFLIKADLEKLEGGLDSRKLGKVLKTLVK